MIELCTYIRSAYGIIARKSHDVFSHVGEPMSPRILDILKEVSTDRIRILPCERTSLDAYLSPYSNAHEHAISSSFETRPPSSGYTRVPSSGSNLSILTYFMDGSRRTYQIADIVDDGSRYMPLVAGQVGVAVLKRDREGRLSPMRDLCDFSLILAFPDRIDEQALKGYQHDIKDRTGMSLELARYSTRVDVGENLLDKGVAAIMRRMHDAEVRAVERLADANQLDGYNWLVIDGPLRFKEMSTRRLDVLQFQYVLGLSKSFRPGFTVGRGRHKADIGAIAANLGFGQRTGTFRAEHDHNRLGVWYLRLRRKWQSPLQGTVKAECYALAKAHECGLDSDTVDALSSHLLRERNVTPYGVDPRWANHIYPIFCSENYVKSSFISDASFLALF